VARIGEGSHGRSDDPMRFGSALHALLQTSADVASDVCDARAHAIARYYRLDESGHDRLRAAAARVAAAPIAAELKAHDTLRREHPFAVTITAPSGEFDLAGSIDVYACSKDHALVVDYKSGTSKANAEELRARYETQARCYALAALREGARQARVVFIRPEVDCADAELEQVIYEFISDDMRPIECDLAEKYERIAHDPYRPRMMWDDAICHGCRISGSLCSLTSRRRVAE
jgi:hypothetical protein